MHGGGNHQISEIGSTFAAINAKNKKGVDYFKKELQDLPFATAATTLLHLVSAKTAARVNHSVRAKTAAKVNHSVR